MKHKVTRSGQSSAVSSNNSLWLQYLKQTRLLHDFQQCKHLGVLHFGLPSTTHDPRVVLRSVGLQVSRRGSTLKWHQESETAGATERSLNSLLQPTSAYHLAGCRVNWARPPSANIAWQCFAGFHPEKVNAVPTLHPAPNHVFVGIRRGRNEFCSSLCSTNLSVTAPTIRFLQSLTRSKFRGRSPAMTFLYTWPAKGMAWKRVRALRKTTRVLQKSNKVYSHFLVRYQLMWCQDLEFCRDQQLHNFANAPTHLEPGPAVLSLHCTGTVSQEIGGCWKDGPQCYWG